VSLTSRTEDQQLLVLCTYLIRHSYACFHFCHRTFNFVLILCCLPLWGELLNYACFYFCHRTFNFVLILWCLSLWNEPLRRYRSVSKKWVVCCIHRKLYLGSWDSSVVERRKVSGSSLGRSVLQLYQKHTER